MMTRAKILPWPPRMPDADHARLDEDILEADRAIDFNRLADVVLSELEWERWEQGLVGFPTRTRQDT